MSNTRRFSITKSQGELISLALTALIDDLEQIIEQNGYDPYWRIQLDRAQMLKYDLNTYQWFKHK